MTEPKNMLIHHASMHWELFSCFIFFLTLLMLAGKHALRHCVDDHLPAVSWTAWYCWTCQIFYLQILFHQYPILCPMSRNILHKLAAP